MVEVAGRNFRRSLNTAGEALDDHARRFSLPKDTPPGLVYLTFVVQKPRYVEFVAHAEQVKNLGD